MTEKPTAFSRFRSYSLTFAESVDAWRIMPRLVLIAYSVLVSHLYIWYKSIPTYVQEACDPATLQIFLDNEVPIEQAVRLGCSIKDVVGGPTPAQTTLVTTIIGLTTIVFAFYTNSGRNWEKGIHLDTRGPEISGPPSHRQEYNPSKPGAGSKNYT